jgi:hypothetical protein
MGKLPFRCVLLAVSNDKEIGTTGYPAPEDFQPTLDGRLPCSYVPLQGKEIVIDGKAQGFTGYLVIVPAVNNGATVNASRKMQVQLEEPGSDTPLTFEIEFAQKVSNVFIHLYCQLIED